MERETKIRLQSRVESLRSDFLHFSFENTTQTDILTHSHDTEFDFELENFGLEWIFRPPRQRQAGAKDLARHTEETEGDIMIEDIKYNYTQDQTKTPTPIGSLPLSITRPSTSNVVLDTLQPIGRLPCSSVVVFTGDMPLRIRQIFNINRNTFSWLTNTSNRASKSKPKIRESC